MIERLIKVKVAAHQKAYGLGGYQEDRLRETFDAYQRGKLTLLKRGGHADVLSDTSVERIDESRLVTDYMMIDPTKLTDEAFVEGNISTQNNEMRLIKNRPFLFKVIHGKDPIMGGPQLGDPFPSKRYAEQELDRTLGYDDDMQIDVIPNYPLLAGGITQGRHGYSLVTTDARAAGWDLRELVLNAGDESLPIVAASGIVGSTMEYVEMAKRRRNGTWVGLDVGLENLFGGGHIVDKYPGLRRGYIDPGGGPFEQAERRKRLYDFSGQICYKLTYCIELCPQGRDGLMQNDEERYGGSEKFKDASTFVTKGWAYRFWRASPRLKKRMIERSSGTLIRASLGDARLIVQLIRARHFGSLSSEVEQLIAQALDSTTRQRAIPIPERVQGFKSSLLPLL